MILNCFQEKNGNIKKKKSYFKRHTFINSTVIISKLHFEINRYYKILIIQNIQMFFLKNFAFELSVIVVANDICKCLYHKFCTQHKNVNSFLASSLPSSSRNLFVTAISRILIYHVEILISLEIS